jgi:hypothetical protein
VLRVHYEDLVRLPEATVQRICEFLELAFDAAMLRPGADLRLNPHEASHGHHRRVGEPITAGSVDTWKESMSPRDIAVVSAVVDSVSRSCGYQVEPAPEPTLWQRVTYMADGHAMALAKLIRDVGQRRPLWHVCYRRWRLGTFWSAARDYVSGR